MSYTALLNVRLVIATVRSEDIQWTGSPATVLTWLSLGRSDRPGQLHDIKTGPQLGYLGLDKYSFQNKRMLLWEKRDKAMRARTKHQHQNLTQRGKSGIMPSPAYDR